MLRSVEGNLKLSLPCSSLRDEAYIAGQCQHRKIQDLVSCSTTFVGSIFFGCVIIPDFQSRVEKFRSYSRKQSNSQVNENNIFVVFVAAEVRKE